MKLPAANFGHIEAARPFALLLFWYLFNCPFQVVQTYRLDGVWCLIDFLKRQRTDFEPLTRPESQGLVLSYGSVTWNGDYATHLFPCQLMWCSPMSSGGVKGHLWVTWEEEEKKKKRETEEGRAGERARELCKNASPNEKQLSVAVNHARKTSNMKSNYTTSQTAPAWQLLRQRRRCTVAKRCGGRQYGSCSVPPTRRPGVKLHFVSTLPNEEMHYDVISFGSRRKSCCG